MRIYVLDDDAAMCRTLARMLSSDGNQVSGFTDPAALLSAMETASPDILLLDIGLDGANGLDILTQVTATRTELPVVMISGTSEVDDAIAAFRGGAVQFLRKPFRRSELDAALNDAARIGEERANRLARTRAASTISLSKREHEVLAGMTEGLQSKLIAHRLGISLRTVDMHRANIFSKLSAKNATHAVSIASQLDLAR